MTLEEMKQRIKDAHHEIRTELPHTIRSATTRNELHQLADVAYDIGEHERFGGLLATKARELGVTEIAVGEYDVDRVFLKIQEVPAANDYYGFGEVDVGEWVSSNY